MFCPNCGNNCGDANFCSKCGHDLRAGNQSFNSEKYGPDLEYYFIKYGRNRIGAIKELRQKTGMSLAEAKSKIDGYFNQKEGNSFANDPDAALRELERSLNPKKAAFKEKKKELDESGQSYCPKCLSTSISANRRGYSLVWGVIGSNKVICTCLKCGHRWRPGK